MGADGGIAARWNVRNVGEVFGRLGIALVFAAAVAGALVVGERFASAPGVSMFALEVAGSAAVAEQRVGGVARDAVVSAVYGDFYFIGCYAAVLVGAALFFPPRAFRVRRFRRSGRIAAGLAVIAAALDAAENVALLRGLDGSGDLPWRVAAIVAWPKFVVIVGVAAYVLLALGTFLLTPRWLHKALRSGEASSNDGGGGSPSTPPKGQRARFGIAASGGGVRSASLVLGSLQALDDAYPGAKSPGPSWTTATKVTAVSGGSYIAGGLSVARSVRRPRPGMPVEKEPSGDRQAWRIERDPATRHLSSPGGQGPEERRLLTRLGYLLAPNPSGSTSSEDQASRDVPGVVALVAVGALLNLAVLTALLWLVVQPYAWVLATAPLTCSQGWGCLVRPELVEPVAVWAAAAGVMLLVWVGSGWVLAAFKPKTRLYRGFAWVNQHGRWGVFGLVVVTTALAVVLLVGPTLVSVLPATLEAQLKSLTPAAVIAAVGAGISLARGLTGRVVRFAPYVGGALFVVLLTIIAVELLIIAPTQDVTVLGWRMSAPLWWAVQVGFALLFYAFVSAEWWSMAGYYRSRLRLAYATYRTKKGDVRAYRNGSVPENEVEPSIYELMPRSDAHPDGSPLAVCATAHATGPNIRRHYGLPAVSVTIDPERVQVHLPLDDEGRSTAIRASTRVVENLLYRRGGARLTTMLAVGVSGAAISPAMGQYRIGPTRALLAAANVRLGVWMPNPCHAARFASPSYVRPEGPYGRIRYPRPRLSYLLKEMFGVHDIDDVYLYVTDGGHWENTGLVELLRNDELDEVVCLDADDKPRQTVSQIANAINLAQMECGVRIRLSLDPLRGPADGGRGGDYSPQSVAVGLIERNDSVGLLWYAKPVLTAEAPLDLLSYAECDAAFPATSTVDQFFHTAQFKAYRDLGRYNARTIVTARYQLALAAHQRSWDDFCTLAKDSDAPWVVQSIAKLANEDTYYKIQAIIGDPADLHAAAAEATCWPHPVPTEQAEKTDDPAHQPAVTADVKASRRLGSVEAAWGWLTRRIQGGLRNRQTRRPAPLITDQKGGSS